MSNCVKNSVSVFFQVLGYYCKEVSIDLGEENSRCHNAADGAERDHVAAGDGADSGAG